MKLLLVLTLISFAHASVTCKDGNGNSVDWFAAIKFPGSLSYIVLTAGSSSFSGTGDLSSNGAIYNTVQQVFNGDASTYAEYNDQTPDGKQHATYGHSKGVMGYAGSEGFFLIHSIPNWPPAVANGYSVPSSAKDNGQSFLCMTLDATNMNQVGQNWQYTRPFIYSSAFADTQLTAISAVISGAHVTQSATNLLKVSSKGGMSFDYFAKTMAWDKEIYMDLIATTYQTDLRAETWMNGVGKIASGCTSDGFSYNVMDITGLSLGGQTWPETKDHSKWCITSGGSPNRVCIGDINRQEGQAHRSGGMMCFENSGVYNSLDNAVTGTSACGVLEAQAGGGKVESGSRHNLQPWMVALIAVAVVAGTVAAVVGVVFAMRRARKASEVDREMA